MFPFTAAPKKQQKVAYDVSKINPSKVFKIKALGMSFNNGLASYFNEVKGSRANFEEAPYDFAKIIEAIDTDSYIKQAYAKYRELFWKEGWDIVSENPEAVAYLYQRIDLLEEIMDRPFQDFLIEAVDQLVKFSNVFVVETRGDIAPLYPGKLYNKPDQLPICGYYLIPTETVKIHRNRFNKPLAYSQSLDETSAYTKNIREPIWPAEEVIHLYMDRKPGRAFGTPFIISVLDDVVALRQIEEDIQNLIHRELIPLYKYKVGTEDRPATQEELDAAAAELNNLRVEGGLILPDRHDVEVIGAEGKALEAKGYLQAFKERVAVGMGLSPHHLGMLSEGGNRSVTDRLDIALYDKVKHIQAYVEEAIRLFIFNPLLREGGFDPSMTPSAKNVSDRCFMRFKEIDIDTQVKKETHAIQKFSANVIDLEEIRIALGLDPDVDHSQLLMNLEAHSQIIQNATIQRMTPQKPVASPNGGTTTPKLPSGPVSAPLKPDAFKPSSGGAANKPNATKGVGNIIRPSNQHGRRMSPNIRHMDESILNDIVELLDERDENE